MNVEAELRLDEALPLLPCDASQVQQVVLNLVMNGAEATRPHGAGGCPCSPAAAEDGEGAVLEVTDDGEGIPKEALDRIFDPFFTTKDEGRAWGWGWPSSTGSSSPTAAASRCGATPRQGTTFEVDAAPRARGRPTATARTPRRAGPEPERAGRGAPRPRPGAVLTAMEAGARRRVPAPGAPPGRRSRSRPGAFTPARGAVELDRVPEGAAGPRAARRRRASSGSPSATSSCPC